MILGSRFGPNPDKNGNLIEIQNPEQYEVKINGKNNIVRIKNNNNNSKVVINISGDDNIIDIGKCILKEFSISVGSVQPTNGAKITIGDHFSIEPGGKFELYTHYGEINIGDNCLFSRNINIHFGESPHLIFDLETGRYIDGNGFVSIGDKVWLGEGSYLSKRAIVSDESIVAARSVVTRKFDKPNCVIGGNPAVVVKEGIQWFRNRSTVGNSNIYSEEIQKYDCSMQMKSEENASKNIFEGNVWGEKWPSETTCLFGVGAMKAGTSYLYDYLLSHPEVHFSQIKEVHYFDVLDSKAEQHHFNSKLSALEKSVQLFDSKKPEKYYQYMQKIEDAYLNVQMYRNASGDHSEYRDFLLKGYKSQKIVGDITPSYTALSRDRLKEMSLLTSSVKFLFVMRDPIERLWSAVRMSARIKKGDFLADCLEIAQSLSKNPGHYMLSRCDYKKVVLNLDSITDSDNVHYMFYESMFNQSARNGLCDFLKIPHFSGSSSRVVNPGRPSDLPDEIRDIFYQILEPQYEFIAERFQNDMPSTWYAENKGD